MQTDPNGNTTVELPYSTLDFKAGIWGAILEQQRDWGDTELEYLRRNQGLREQLWDYINNVEGVSTTEVNYSFLEGFIYKNPGVKPSDYFDIFETA